MISPRENLTLFGLLIFSALLIVAERRPNVIVILTDDQDIVLEGFSPMNNTRRLFARHGVMFENAYATTPLCCPSRSSILTGLYVHNHGTRNNSITGGCCGLGWKEQFEPRTFATALHAAGYRTFYAGKYLNQYGHKKAGGVEHIPEGWDWWVGLVGNSVYYNYTLSVNGSADFREDADRDYLTDVIAEYGMEFLKSTAEPFLMVFSTPAPHEPFTPASRHRGVFSQLKAPRTPNFNKVSCETKHWLLRQPPSTLPPHVVDQIDEAFRDRWETLLAVDEMVQGIVHILRQSKILKNTYIIFTSDNGFHLGQFALPWDKRQPYETDIKIPLMIMGPQVPKGRVLSQVVLNIDIAPTILDLAGVGPTYPMDGRSFLSLVNSIPSKLNARSFLVEYFGEGSDVESGECNDDPNVKLCSEKLACKCLDSRNNTYSCIRQLGKKRNEIYCWFNDREEFAELYDLKRDPYQMDNIAFGIKEWRTKRYQAILDCCRRKVALGKKIEKCLTQLYST